MKSILEYLKEGNPFDRIYLDETRRKPFKITVVLCQPRSGSTLMLRLMNSACMTHMVGDRHPSFYEGCVNIWRALNHPGYYGHPITLEGNFPAEYRGTSKAREFYNTRFAMSLNHGDGAFSSGYSKTTTVGFGNKLTQEYVQMLREFYDNSEYDLTIAFLTRDHDEIIRSMVKQGDSVATNHPDKFKDLLEDQLNQFKEATDLGDPWFTYQDLVSDPVKTLRKLNPLYAPAECMVEYIMENEKPKN